MIKYLLEGLAIALATTIVSKGTLTFRDVALVSLSATAVFLVLDMFAPLTGRGARTGAGFGLGFKMVGGGCGCGGSPQVAGAWGMEPSVKLNKASKKVTHSGGYQQGLIKDQKPETVKDSVTPPHALPTVQKGTNLPYRLVEGQYSAGTLLAGFNENANAYNEEDNSLLAPF
jgi:hypothetical protein